MSQTITCPSCKTCIDLSKLSEEKYKKELEEEFEKEREKMRKKALEFAERKTLEQAKKDALEMDDLKIRLKEQEQKSEEMKKNELEMRVKARKLEEQEKNFELEMARKLDIARKKIEEDMSKIQSETIDIRIKEIQEENRKKESEMIKQQEQMKKTIDDLKRKAEQWSQQIQGDIQEDYLKQAISQAFPIDNIDDVPTGVKWADLIQVVKNSLWQEVWSIIWESKNTKSWIDSWILKLKDDKIKVNGNIAILVTTVLPKNMKNFGMVDDVMLCIPEFAIPVATMLRDRIISISKVEKSLVWKDIKMEMLYKYLSSEEFSSKISMMVDVFSQLKSWIDSERRAMEKNWKKREKDLERATFAVTWIYWELESLMWQALPWSEKLELWYEEI